MQLGRPNFAISSTRFPSSSSRCFSSSLSSDKIENAVGRAVRDKDVDVVGINFTFSASSALDSN